MQQKSENVHKIVFDNTWKTSFWATYGHFHLGQFKGRVFL